MNDKKKDDQQKRDTIRESVRKDPDFYVPDPKNPPPPTQDPRDKSRRH